MEGENIENIEEIKPTNKTRLSLFLPPDTTMTVKENSSFDEKYITKVKSEENSWKQVYNEQKEEKSKLIKKLDLKEPKTIDYSLFTEEEIHYLTSGPDVAAFVKKAEELQNAMKILCIKRKEKREMYNAMLQQIESGCEEMSLFINNK